MSYGDVSGGGQPGMYVPPPPAARGRSPWLYVGLGCGLLVLLSFAGCAVFVAQIGKNAKQAMNQPFDAPKAVASLQSTGVPVYPGAKINEKMSKVMQGTMNATFGAMKFIPGMGNVTSNVVVFDAPGTDGDVIAKWYDTKMLASGWKTSTTKNKFGGSTPNVQAQRQYVKGDTQVLVQVSEATESTATEKPRRLALMAFKGLPADK